MIAVPPSLDGAVQVSVATVSPAVAFGASGVPGTPCGVAGIETAEYSPVPTEFTAATRK
ncbi:unannotated protein [freshwater metagenome]|uniref:Unannotated protein n=1 Tax=freshwater metagenome TaxID=449393 RepID=A0A6J7HQ69_9ZZZZ